jgi:nitrous oxide reductase
MKKFEILSYTTHVHECGFRLNLIDHEPVFVYSSNPKTIIDESLDELFISIDEYDKKYDYSTTPAKEIGIDKGHVNECIIYGNKQNIKKFQSIFGYSSTDFDAIETQKNNDLTAAIDDLKHTVSMFEKELYELRINSFEGA